MMNTPGFMEIERSPCGDNPPWVTMGVPPELTKEQNPIRMTGSMMFSIWLFQDSMSGATYIDMLSCSMAWWAWDLLPWQLTTPCPPCWERRTQILNKSSPYPAVIICLSLVVVHLPLALCWNVFLWQLFTLDYCTVLLYMACPSNKVLHSY